MSGVVSDEEPLKGDIEQSKTAASHIYPSEYQRLLWRNLTLSSLFLNFVTQIIVISFVSSNSLGDIDFFGVNWKNFFVLITTISTIIFGVAGFFGILTDNIILVQFYFIVVVTNCSLHIVMMVALEMYFYIGLVDMLAQLIVAICVWKTFEFLKELELFYNTKRSQIKKQYIQCMGKNKFCDKFNPRYFTMCSLGLKTVGTVGFIVLIMNAPIVNWVASFGAYFEFIFNLMGLYGIWNGISKFIMICFVYNILIIILHISPLIMEQSALTLSIAAVVTLFELSVAFTVWKVYTLLRKVHFEYSVLLIK